MKKVNNSEIDSTLFITLLKALTSKITVLVGESGSGKSTILKSIAGLLKTKDGQIKFDNDRILSSDLKMRNPNDLRAIQLIFQNPDESLNPNNKFDQILSIP